MQPLPSNESLLLIADILHNFLTNRRYDTIAVGAIGESPLKTLIMVGINSAAFHEIKITKDRIIPPVIRNSQFANDIQLKFTQEPYHAEISIILAAKDMNYKVYGLASSRKVCAQCDEFLQEHKNILDTDFVFADCWLRDGRILTQQERMLIDSFDWNAMKNAKAVRCKDY